MCYQHLRVLMYQYYHGWTTCCAFLCACWLFDIPLPSWPSIFFGFSSRINENSRDNFDTLMHKPQVIRAHTIPTYLVTTKQKAPHAYHLLWNTYVLMYVCTYVFEIYTSIHYYNSYSFIPSFIYFLPSLIYRHILCGCSKICDLLIFV